MLECACRTGISVLGRTDIYMAAVQYTLCGCTAVAVENADLVTGLNSLHCMPGELASGTFVHGGRI